MSDESSVNVLAVPPEDRGFQMVFNFNSLRIVNMTAPPYIGHTMLTNRQGQQAARTRVAAKMSRSETLRLRPPPQSRVFSRIAWRDPQSRSFECYLALAKLNGR
jgi:hypothetical protein